ncbi:hypothetical protein [Robertmurraya andreesenii]|uniref:MFS transporter n=1 Tax=Anoxybacillus andreesenii TaxID=1325932 RepID=A0ABT9V5A7_9BACL|nr:hypothetical protein [Robertmurraya andreesenii]MDQ0156130.1 hypothetical protein [Robertmurraya andreesenii]
MGELIAAAVSLIILVPIIYFLPIGLTNKGKGLIILVAFLFANLGILAKNNFPLWQTGLIIVLLTFLTVYILEKRFHKYLFSTGTNEDELTEIGLEDLDELGHLVNEEVIEPEQGITLEKKSVVQEEEKLAETAMIPLIEDEPIELEKLMFGLDKQGQLVQDLEEQNEQVDIQDLIDLQEQTEPQEPVDLQELMEQEELVETVDSTASETVEIELDDEIAFLAEREAVVEEFAASEDEEPYSEGYLSEIEQLLEDDSLDEEILMEEVHQSDAISSSQVEPEISSDLAISDILIDELNVLSELNCEHETIENLEIKPPVNQMEFLDDDLELESELEVLEFGDVNSDESSETGQEDTNKAIYDWMLEDDLELEDDYLLGVIGHNEVAASLVDGPEEAEEGSKELDGLKPQEEIGKELESPIEEQTFSDYQEDVEKEIVESEANDNSQEEKTEQVSYQVPNELGVELETQPPRVEEETLDSITASEAVWKEEQKSALQQQLFLTMLSQLQLVSKHMPAEQYEELIKEHLHPDLSAQDYYSFASLLIQHYLSQKEIGKLKELLTNLEGKFENYPILDMEIHYLYKQYCENAR